MTISARDFNYVRKLVRERSALVLERGKEYLVESRLDALAQQEGFPSIQHLIKSLSSDSSCDLERKVVEAMVTHETTFFRNIRSFDVLRTVVIPELLVRRASARSLNLWCAASSGGQEPYSVAMLLREHFPSLAAWTVRFIASDISRPVLERARAGLFSQMEINRGLPAALLVKYFQKCGADWQIHESIRRMVKFQEVNLVMPWPSLPTMDIIFMRNVLIYFDSETRTSILGHVHRLLRPDGYLFLGGSESTMGLDQGFEPVSHDRTACFRLKERRT
jgi:chemotaxis protein methyltransferase CheR